MAGKRSLTNLHIHSLKAEGGLEALETKLSPQHEPSVKHIIPMAKVDRRRVDKSWKVSQSRTSR